MNRRAEMTTMIDFKTKRKQLLEQIRQMPPGAEALKLLATVRLEFDCAIDDYQNSLAILGDTTYEDRKHFLLELIQNADDASYNMAPFITFNIFKESIELEYNEEGFTIEDVIAITGTGASTKSASKFSAQSFIGEKGIGFKSVFALAKTVEINSGPWHFELSKDNYIVPNVIEDSSIEPGTRVKILFQEEESVSIVAHELMRLVTRQVESFLFLQKLSTFKVIDWRLEDKKEYGLLIEPPDRKGNDLSLITSPIEEKREYIMYESEAEFSGSLVAERWERLGSSSSLKRKMIASAIVDSSNERMPTGRLFCYLPTEVLLPIPIFLQIDGHLKADRERLHAPEHNRWNKHLLSLLPSFIVEAILSWRYDSRINDKLADYVPHDSGEDQLYPVINEVIKRCKHEPWIKTFDGWESPDNVIFTNAFWVKWFKKEPEFREAVEKLLGKKVINPKWAENYAWEFKWRTYNIGKLKAAEVAIILKEVKIPDEMLEGENLTELYRQLNRVLDNVRSYNRRNLGNEIAYSKMFPFENGNFGALKEIGKPYQYYWISSRVKRVTGLEGSLDIKIINPEYTYNIQINKETNEERKNELELIAERNKELRALLSVLEIPELNDERILSELQIPYLLNDNLLNEELLNSKLEVWRIIFEGFQAKQTFDDSYLEQLARLSNMMIVNNNGQLEKLSSLILPNDLRLYDEDKLYAELSLNEVSVPISWVSIEAEETSLDETYTDKEELLIKKLRRFLIHCGISNGPKFETLVKKYDNTFEFKQQKADQFERWQDRIKNDYTYSNVITVNTVTLDNSTIEIIDSNDFTTQLVWGIYEEWKKQYRYSLDNTTSFHYRYSPPPGYFQTVYKRFELRRPIFRDDKWAGVKKEKVPLVTVGNVITYLNKCYRISNTKGLDHSFSFFDFVLENDNNGFHSFYLDSLEVEELTVDVVNALWKSTKEENYPKLLNSMLELANLNFDFTGLTIYDYSNERFRPITDFKLGKAQFDTVPYIEEQYGFAGKLLGEKLNLLIESEVTPLLNIIDKMYVNGEQPEEIAKEIFKLLTQWRNLTVSEKGKITQYLHTILSEHNILEPTIIILNDDKMANILREHSDFVFSLEINKVNRFSVERSVKEIGFKLLSEVGSLKTTNDYSLSDGEKDQLESILSSYMNDLEDDEKSRFYSLFFEKRLEWSNQIIIVERLEKVFFNEVIMPVPLPYFSLETQSFYVGHESRMDEIIARLLSFKGFSTYRSALRDIGEILENEKKKKFDMEVKQRKAEVKKEIEFQEIYEDGKQEVLESGMNETSEAGHGGDKAEREKKEISPEPDDLNQVVTSDEGGSMPPPSDTTSDVLTEIKSQLSKDGTAMGTNDLEDWKTTINTNEEAEIRIAMGQQIDKALNDGPEIKEIRKREPKKDSKQQDIKMVDATSLEPKEFFISEYNGRCQVCSTQLTLHNGKKYFEIFRIREEKGEKWWVNRPFNILCLCPNCHAVAKHGGKLDLSNIFQEAESLINNKIFAEEVEEFSGDYYLIDVVINNKDRTMVMSQQHLNYFAALLEQSRKTEQT